MYWNDITHPLRFWVKEPKAAFDFYIKFAVTRFLDKKVFHRNFLMERAKKRGNVEQRLLMTEEEFSEVLFERIRSGEPMFVSRFGTAELGGCMFSDFCHAGYIDAIPEDRIKALKMNTGVFPESKEMYLHFAEIYKQALCAADFTSYWGNALLEEYYLNKYYPKDVQLMEMTALDSFRGHTTQPWTYALKGKKVIVVHPFVDEIQAQYKRRELLFADSRILPEFELITVKAIQSSGKNTPEGIRDWDEALHMLFDECQKHDYEVALLGCGSYAVPLGKMIKDAGKQAIVMGSAIQLLFGIKGKRWDDTDPEIVSLYNDSWIRAGKGTIIAGAEEKADGASYW